MGSKFGSWNFTDTEYITEPLIPLCIVGAGVVAVVLIKRYTSGGVCRSTARLEGKTVVITGANTGIGKETAIDLAKRGARVILACRDMEKGSQALKEVCDASGSPHNVALYHLDLASLKSVRKCADEILKSEDKINILINNAGVMMCPYTKTEDGFEMQFGTNHLGHFLFTHLLLDRIKTSAPSRIVNVSSVAHSFGKMNFEDLMSEKKYNSITAYGQSKLANILFTRELARKLEGTGVTVYALHPGAVKTELARHTVFDSQIFKFLFFPLIWLLWKNSWQGAQTSIYCAVAEELEGISGKYYSDCAEKKTSRLAQNDDDARKLWEISEKLVGMKS
ncbi:retinol dehydrogenase 12 [Lingula anatina]|uniref:Retinol dehydrogenase 12 n=1 Tax=Lingula anatina TaxID=7574 RepID=A0A1S3JQV8_LINAN|nr:retinol dehydrogenase 12 [Lingula anatina]|eukprot:XP_013412742.1 retinol dehydrogenase 12 [Lingula anatina]